MYIEAAPIERRLHHSTFGACSEPGRDMEGLRFLRLPYLKYKINMVKQYSRINIGIAVEITVAITLFVLGGYIYIAFRSTTLRMFDWFNQLGLYDIIMLVRNSSTNINPSDIVRYSIPDGLWILSYILFMDAIWKPNLKKQLLFSSIIPIVGGLSEILQYFNVLRGTFDVIDLLCYVIPFILYLILKFKL